MNGVDRLIDRLERGMDVLAGISLLLMMLVISADALGRFFGSPVQGAYEFTAYYLMVIVAFGALPRSFRTGGQVKLDLLEPWLSRIPGRAAYRLVILLSLAAFLLLFWFSAGDAWRRISHRDTTFGVIQWPIYLSYVWLPIGVGILSLRLALEFVRPGEESVSIGEDL